MFDVKTIAHGMAGMVVAAGLTVVAAGDARAQGPSFDCAKASGAVQTLICKDAGLAALDRKLDGVYKAAVAKAKGPVLTQLRAEQRGWVKGRDDCWKAQTATPTYMTATWVVSDVRACAEASYQLRTAELQVRFALVPSKPPVSYACNNNPANEVVGTFFASELPAARFERGDRTVVAYQTKTVGNGYEGQNFSFAPKGTDVAVTWLDEQLTCKTK